MNSVSDFNSDSEIKKNGLSVHDNHTYKYIFEKAPIGIIYYNEQGVITTCNDRFVEIVGSTREQLIGKDLTQLPDKNIREAIYEALGGVVGVYEGEYMTVTSHRLIAIRVEFHPLHEDGKKTGIGMIQDISQRYYANMKLKESEERYRTIFTRSHNVMLLIDMETGLIKDANPAALRFYGWTKRQILRKKISEINILSARQVAEEMEKARKEEKNSFHFKHRLADGQIRDVEVYSGLVRFDGNMFLYSIVHDITDRLTYERELKKFKLGIERSSNVVFITDREGNIEYVNPSFTKVYGYSLDEVKGSTPRILKSGKQSDDHYQKFWETITSGKEMTGEFVNKTKQGELLNVSFSSNPIIDDEGRNIGYIAIQEDITERKKKDKKLIKSLKEKKVLLSEVHHRVKNNMAVISALLELNLYQDEKEDIEEFIRNSQLRIKAMANVHELLYQQETFSTIPFKEYAQKLVDSIISTQTESKFLPKVLLEIDDVKLNINQAVPVGLILNELIINSMNHAFKGQKNPEIKVKLKNRDSYIFLTVRDNGTGIPGNIDFSEMRSFGLTLIRILSSQLEAELEMKNIPDGFQTTLTFERNLGLKGASASFI